MAEEAHALRSISRFVTDHDAEGKAVFNKEIPEQLEPSVVGQGDKFFLGYTTVRPSLVSPLIKSCC